MEAAPLLCSLVLHEMRGSARKAAIVLVPTGNPPSLRFGHPDVTFGRYRLSSLELAGLPVELCGRGRVFRMRPQGVSPDALRCEARRGGASG